jgi:hypothetical protein
MVSDHTLSLVILVEFPMILDPDYDQAQDLATSC